MEVILLKTSRLGKVGDIVKVKDGYGRNFLIPGKAVLRATDANKAIFAERKVEIEKQNQEKIAHAESIAKKIREVFVVLIRQAGEDGRLFGSVTTRDIAGQLEIDHSGVKIDRNEIVLQTAIKYLGVYEIKIELHPEVIVKAFVNIARSEVEATEAKKTFLSPPPPPKKETFKVPKEHAKPQVEQVDAQVEPQPVESESPEA